MASRLSPLSLEECDAETTELLTAVSESMGFLPNDALIIARKPGIAKALALLVKEVQQAGELSDELKRLVALASSIQADCRYCVSHTRFAVLRAGISEAKVAALSDWRTSAVWADDERAAIRMAVHASKTPNEVSDADFLELKRYFSDTAITELVAVIALFGFLNRWNSTFATEVEDICKL